MPRERELGRLGEPVMHHLGRNLHAGFARDEDDAAPIPPEHRRDQRASKPHPAHDVQLEEAEPVLIRNLEEGNRLEDADIVDEDIDAASALQQAIDPFRVREIGGDAGGARSLR